PPPAVVVPWRPAPPAMAASTTARVRFMWSRAPSDSSTGSRCRATRTTSGRVRSRPVRTTVIADPPGAERRTRRSPSGDRTGFDRSSDELGLQALSGEEGLGDFRPVLVVHRDLDAHLPALLSR